MFLTKRYRRLPWGGETDPVPKPKKVVVPDTTKVPFIEGGMTPGWEIPDESNDQNPFEKQRLFFKRYIGSPKYMDRLKKQGYSDPEGTKNARLKKVTNTEGKWATREQAMDWPVGTTGEYNQYTNSFAAMDEQSAAHEFGHAAAMDRGLPQWIDKGGLNTKDMMDITIRNRNPASKHDKQSSEVKADLDMLRYMMRRDRLYDAATQDFTPDNLKKAKEVYRDKLGSLGNIKDEDVIWLMNNIAKNKSQNMIKPFA